MSERVRSKLHKLIQDLEGAVEQADQQEGQVGTSQLESGSSTVSLGLSDLTKTETSSGSGVTPGSQQASSSKPAGSSGVRRHAAELEAKVLELLLDRKATEARHSRDISIRDAELARLQQYIDEELAELQARQAQVEESAPSVRMQLQEARAALRNILISDDRYHQLKKAPDDKLSLPDAVRLTVHEALKQLTDDNERLRLAAASSREAALRHESEVSRLQRENARLAAAVADKDSEVATTISALESRAARLSAELEDVSVALEVAKAKAGMYDELQTNADRLESEVSRLSGIEAAAERLRTQLAAADSAVNEKVSTMSLLISDKAYLSKEVQVCEERISDLSNRLVQQEDKVSQLKQERHELYQKLAAASDSARNQDESRWEREVGQLQATAAADLERIRKEAADTAEREARMLRDLRDTALDEASRTKSELRQLRVAHEELLLSSREAASRADVSHSELLGEIKLKSFELARLQALCDERGTAIKQLELQVALLSEKLQLLTAELNQQELDNRNLMSDLQQQLDRAQTKLREYQATEGILDRAILGATTAGGDTVSGLQQQLAALLAAGPAATASWGGTAAAAQQEPFQQQQQQEPANQQLSGAMQRRIQHNLQLAARCARLEAEKQQLAQQKTEVEDKLVKAQAAVQKLHSQLQLAGQPHGFLLSQLQAAEADKNAAEVQLRDAQAALHVKEEQEHQSSAERAALRRDLERILRERGTLESMRRLVATAVASASAAAAAGATGTAAAALTPASVSAS